MRLALVRVRVVVYPSVVQGMTAGWSGSGEWMLGTHPAEGLRVGFRVGVRG